MSRISLLFLLLAVLGAPQQAPAHPSLAKRITAADGLPSNNVNAMAQDDKGFIWFGTSSGPCRYDGYSMAAFSQTGYDEASLKVGIGGITADTLRRLVWIRTSANAWFCFDTRRSRFVDYAPGADKSRAYSDLTLTKGGAWLHSPINGALHIAREGDTFRATPYATNSGTLAGASIARVVEGAGGRVFLLTTKGLFIAREGKAEPVGRGKSIVAGAVAGDKTVFLASDATLLTLGADGRTISKKALGPKTMDGMRVTADMVWRGQWLIFTNKGTLTINLARGEAVSTPPQLNITHGQKLIVNDTLTTVYDLKTNVLIFLKDDVRSVSLGHFMGNAHSVGNRIKPALGGDGRLYMASNRSGLISCDLRSGQLTLHTPADRRPLVAGRSLVSILSSRDGTLWVGNEAAGVSVIATEGDGQMARLLPDAGAPGGQGNRVRHVAPAGDGSILLSTLGNSLYKLNPTTGAVETLGSTNSCVYATLTDTENRHWVGTRGDGLYIDGTRYAQNSPTHGIASNHIFDIEQDARGRVWIATWGAGLLLATPGQGGQPFAFSQVAGKEGERAYVRRVCIAADGTMWVATNGGLLRADTRAANVDEGSFALYSRAKGNFPITNIVSLSVARDGKTIYAGGPDCGLIVARPAPDGKTMAAEAITTAQGLANNNVLSIAEDAFGCVWAATEDGLSRIAPGQPWVITLRSDGDISDNVYMENAVCAAPDGRLLFGTNNGVAIVAPTPLGETAAHKPTITGISVNGARLEGWPCDDFAGRLSLAHDENSVEITFSSLAYTHVSSTYYSFRLDGVDTSWRLTSQSPQAAYANLSPGDYVFRVKTIGEGTTWSDEATLTLTVLRPWWNTWWAWTLYALAALALASWLYTLWLRGFKLRQQMEGEKRMNEFRISFFTNIAHEFRTPLALIKSSADKLAGAPGAPKAPAQTLRRAVARLALQVDQLLEFRRINTGNLRLAVESADIVALVQGIVRDFWGAASQKEIALTFTPCAKSLAATLDKRMVETMVYNIVGNAIKYTPEKGAVGVAISADEERVAISVSDTGPGVSEEQMQWLFKPFMHGYVGAGGMGIGLYVAKSMANAHKGDIEYSRTGYGRTLFRITLPARDDAYSPEERKQTTAIAKPEEAERERDEAEIRQMMPKPINSARVAIVEDDTDMLGELRQAIGEYFVAEGHERGAEAVESITSSPPALVVCDIMLPDISGFDVVKALRNHDATRRIPIIMLSAIADDEQALRAIKAGTDECMAKPCSFSLLIAHAIRLMEKASEATESPAKEPREKAILATHHDQLFKENVRGIVMSHISDTNFSVDDIAAALGIGRSKLFEKTKELFGVSPNKLILDERLSLAAQLLAEKELTAGEVAQKVGMLSTSYFSRVFRDKYGVTPARYGKKEKT